MATYDHRPGEDRSTRPNAVVEETEPFLNPPSVAAVKPLTSQRATQMRKLTAELKTISVCDKSLIMVTQAGHLQPSLKLLFQPSQSVGMSFQTWQKMKSQTMHNEMRVRRFSLDFMSSLIINAGLDPGGTTRVKSLGGRLNILVFSVNVSSL